MELSEEQRDQYICDNINLVRHIINQHNYFDGSNRGDDLLSEGLIGLIKAVDSFDPARHHKFSSYAARCIRNQIITYIRKENRYYCHINTNVRQIDIADLIENISSWQSESAESAVISKILYSDFLDHVPDSVSRIIFVSSLDTQALHHIKSLSARYHMDEQTIYRMLRSLRAQFQEYYYGI